VLGAEDAVELLQREPRDRVVAMHEDRDVAGEALRGEPRVGDLDGRQRMELHPLECHVLHRQAQLATDERDVAHVGIERGDGGLRAVELGRDARTRLALLEPVRPQPHQGLVLRAAPDADLALHAIGRLIRRRPGLEGACDRRDGEHAGAPRTARHVSRAS
jgi:hypothetical protein